MITKLSQLHQNILQAFVLTIFVIEASLTQKVLVNFLLHGRELTRNINFDFVRQLVDQVSFCPSQHKRLEHAMQAFDDKNFLILRHTGIFFVRVEIEHLIEFFLRGKQTRHQKI